MGLFGKRLFSLTPEQIQKNQETFQKRQAEESECFSIIDSFFKYNPDEISWIAICLFAAYNEHLQIATEGGPASGVCLYNNEKGQ